MKNNQRGFVNITIAVVIVAGIVGFVAWKNDLIPKIPGLNKENSQKSDTGDIPSDPITTQDTQKSKITGSALVDMSNWKTYVSSKFGFSLKYPPIMIVEENEGTDDSFMYLNLYKPSSESQSKPLEDYPVITMTIAKTQLKCQQIAQGASAAQKAGYVVKNLGNNTFITTTTVTSNAYGASRTAFYIQTNIPCKTIEVSMGKAFPKISMDELKKMGGINELAKKVVADINLEQYIPTIEALLGSISK